MSKDKCAFYKSHKHPPAPKHVVTSTYRKDYRGIMVKRPDAIVLESDYPEVIVGPHLDPMLPDKINAKQEKSKQVESANSIYCRITERVPTLKEGLLESNVNQEYVIPEYSNIGKTVYMVDYNLPDNGYESQITRRRRRVPLPKNWGPTPLTTQRLGYRDLAHMANFELRAKLVPPAPCSLGLSQKMQEILCVTTGKTEYQEQMCTLGGEIVNEAYYGEVKKLPHEYTRIE